MKFSVFLMALVLCASSVYANSKIQPWVWKATENGKTAEFFVILKEQADLSPAATMSSRMDRGRFVFAMLRDTAERSQKSLQSLLQTRAIFYRSFHIVNALLVNGDRALAEELAARQDVERIEGNPTIRNVLPQPEGSIDEPATVEQNIQGTGAPSLWALGFTGQGIVVGGQDTGYRWTHNALKNQYRGWNGAIANHDYNWHDAIHTSIGPCGANSTQPCDDHGHGTHTMGTVVGDDGAGNQIGMAPGAKWIGCRNMNSGNGTPATYLECFEFFLAPYPVGGTPAQGDPSKAPDVTNNSWGCPGSEGCSDLTLESAVNAQKAAGIMTVVAAGNSGSGCSTVDDPPALYDSSYTVGATQNDSNMASFSSRGPADATALIKPNIVAPGVSVRSAGVSTDSSFQLMSGTSMASPNVAGGVALLWSALPELKNDQDSTEVAINDGALRLTTIVEACGGNYSIGPNNTWGHGRMNVSASYLQVCTPAVPSGIVLETGNGNQVDLTWDTSENATSYEVHRGNGACPGTSVAMLDTTASAEYSDTSGTPGNTYSYYVKSVRDDCVSAASTCVDTAVLACVFCDDFEDDLRAEDWTYEKGTWIESDGELQGSPTQRKASAVASPAFEGCDLCTIRVVLSVTGSSTRAGIVGWQLGKDHSVELMLKEATDTWVLKQRVNRKVVTKAKGQSSIVPGTFYTVVLSYNGSEFQVEVDGSLLFSLTPAAPVPSGTIGFNTRIAPAKFESIEVF